MRIKVIKIPLTRYFIIIQIFRWGSLLNGNGYKHKTLQFTIKKIIWTWDDGSRQASPIPR